MAAYANPEALVETDWLETRLKDPKVRIIEVDEDTAAYDKGHIPNAIGWNWNTDLHAPVGRDYVDRRAWRPYSGRPAWAPTPPSSCTGETTTGSLPMPTGSSSIWASMT